MRLPNSELAIVEKAKIADYLLSETHEDGRGKARFFLSFGFRSEEPEVLDRALLTLARTNDVDSVEPSPHGTKYVIVGAVQAPNGHKPVERTVWIIDNGQQVPRLITAFPGRRSSP